MNQSKNFSHFNRFEVDDNKETDTLLDNESGLTRCCQTCLICLPILFALVVLVLFSIMIGNLNSDAYVDKQSAIRIMHNFDKLMYKAPIVQVQAVATSKVCPDGFQKEMVGEFEGVKSGCLCDDGKIYNSAKCLVSSQCTYVNKRSEVQEYVHDNYFMCVLRAKYWQHIKKYGAACPSGYTTCAYEICVKDSVCPATKIAYTKEVVIPPATVVAPTYLLEVKDQGRSNDESHNAVVDIESVQSAKNQCLDPELRPAKISGLNYPLNKRPKGNCGKFGYAKRALEVNTVDQLVWEKQNSLTDLYKNLPYYKSKFFKSGDNYRLLGFTRPSFINKDKCNAEDFEHLGKLVNSSDAVTKGMYIFGVICLVLACLVIVFGLLVFIMRKKGTGFFAKPVSVWFVNILAIITAILIIVFAIMCMVHYSDDNISSVHKKFDAAIQNKCLIQTYRAPAEYMNNYNKLIWDVCYPLGLSLFIISIVFLVLIFLAFVVRISKGVSPCSPI